MPKNLKSHKSLPLNLVIIYICLSTTRLLALGYQKGGQVPPGLTLDNGSGPKGRCLVHAGRDGKHSVILILMGVVRKLTATAVIVSSVFAALSSSS